METDDLEEKWEQLNLIEEEHFVIEIGVEDLVKTMDKGDKSLVGKVWSDRRVRKEVLRTTLLKI